MAINAPNPSRAMPPHTLVTPEPDCPAMSDTLMIPLPIDADLAQALAAPDAQPLRLQMGRFVSRLLRARTESALLLDSIGRLKVHAHMRGLTDAVLEEELTLSADEAAA